MIALIVRIRQISMGIMPVINEANCSPAALKRPVKPSARKIRKSFTAPIFILLN